MGPSQPVTAGRAPVAESEQGAEPSCLVLGQLGPLAQAIPATSFGRAVSGASFYVLDSCKVMRAWVGTLLGAGGLHLLALALALAPWFGTFKRRLSRDSWCPLPPAYEHARAVAQV